MNQIVNVFHEVLVDLACLADHPPLAAEDIDCHHRKKEKDEHEPASLGCHFNE